MLYKLRSFKRKYLFLLFLKSAIVLRAKMVTISLICFFTIFTILEFLGNSPMYDKLEVFNSCHPQELSTKVL